ncbi:MULTISPECIES: amidase family protein [unclassified Bradyrhizobium]|uniref:amidase n=1 Tax=unclassified Bradyrhizobium TaxID=2631580 RepID=UPI001FFB87D9|nr:MULTISPECIES: amidase family protein [unclassified Bradyrhizobium]MCK1297373.1 amidase [Bradyrhizobium sp. 37]MCK1769079.1 amidase [Bradyrhizobium sp. 134]
MSIKDLYVCSDALGLAASVRKGDVSARELVEVAIECIEDINPQLNAVVSKRYDYARALADRTVLNAPFAGVPFLLKDLALEWEGFPVTNGSAYFKDCIATSNWELATRMKAAGLIPLGKTNTPEMGRSSSTEPRLFGATRNPWHPDIVAGGSSGGAGAAVASRMVPIADASDGGGSIRMPASLNGLVGLKPSRGRITFGPDVVELVYGGVVYLCLSRTVRDTAAYLDAVAGAMPGDPYALPLPERSYLSLLSEPKPQQLKIGFSMTQPDGRPLGVEQRRAVENAVKACGALGHELTEANFRYDFEHMMTISVRIHAAKTASHFDSSALKIGRQVTKEDVENVTWEDIELGRALTAVQHAEDIEAMRLFARNFVRQFHAFDVVISPVLADAPHPRGWLDMSLDLESFDQRLIGDLKFTAPLNQTGQPAISLPLHQTNDGKPIGVQFAGRIGDEATLISLAGQLEQLLSWKDRKPKVIAG